MLEAIKEVLISEKQHQLTEKEQIKTDLTKLQEEEIEKYNEFDEKLALIEKEISSINNNFIKRIIKNKKIKNDYDSYINLSHEKNKYQKELFEKKKKLICRLSQLNDDKLFQDLQINKIKSANSLEELDITEKQAIEKLKNRPSEVDKKIIRNVFERIKNQTERLRTREDVFKTMQMLYQTNASQFSISMRKLLPVDIISELKDIVTVDCDKLNFLMKLPSYVLNESNSNQILPTDISKLDNLDRYYYGEIEKGLSSIKDYSKYNKDYISKMTTLTILVSLAKNNRKNKD